MNIITEFTSDSFGCLQAAQEYLYETGWYDSHQGNWLNTKRPGHIREIRKVGEEFQIYETRPFVPALTIVRFKVSGRYLVDAPPTGFTTTVVIKRATRFASVEHARHYMAKRGISWETELLDGR